MLAVGPLGPQYSLLFALHEVGREAWVVGSQRKNWCVFIIHEKQISTNQLKIHENICSLTFPNILRLVCQELVDIIKKIMKSVYMKIPDKILPIAGYCRINTYYSSFEVNQHHKIINIGSKVKTWLKVIKNCS